MRIKFDFLDLEVFLAVSDAGTFNAAAENLGLSQSSVTRRIQKLEEALDVSLFVRTTRAVKPTLAGKRLRLRAEAILSETIEATRALHDESMTYAYQRARTVTIAALPTTIAGVVAPAIEAFRNMHSDTRFRILDLAANEVAEAVAHGEADFGICSVPAYEPATEFERLFVDEMVIAMPEAHLLASADVLSWQDLSLEPIILPARGTGNRMLIDDALASVGVPLVWVLEVNRTSTALDLVSRGVALAPVPRSAADQFAGTSVSAVPIISPKVSRTIGLLTRAGQVTSPRLREFIELIKRYCADA
jgi:DNA-binding transcriptional LysR family regulator